MPTRKHEKFVREPMRDKSVRELAGIRAKFGAKLEDDGYHKAESVFYKFLDLKKQKDKFKTWLEDICEAFPRHEERMDDCYQCLKEYCEIHMPSTSKKHDDFFKGEIGDKSVRNLPGIGRIFGGRLERSGYGKAARVLDMFRELQKDEYEFKKWLKTECETSSKHSKQLHECYQCLKEYCETPMPSTSKKHDDFVKEPIGEKSVRNLPGICNTFACRLERRRYGKAYKVLDKFLSLEEDENKFKKWPKKKCKASSEHSSHLHACYNCLKEYCERPVPCVKKDEKKFKKWLKKKCGANSNIRMNASNV